jgi:RNA polymerase sigma-70 factor (ECF subfamily)
MESEQTIIRLAKSGDERAFETLVHSYSHRLFATALRVLGDKESAEECVQEVFIKVHRKLNTFNEDAKFSTWLYSVTMNTAIDLQRKNAKFSSTDSEDFERFHSDESTNPVKSLWLDELGNRTQQALMQLSTDVRVAFVLRHHENRSIEEISNILEVNPNTVKGRIFRAVAHLREILAPEVGHYEAME